MNRIYSLRYSAVARGFIAVSEFARKCVHKSVRRLCFPVLLLIPVLFSAGSLAGTVNNELGYQLFRDFAENKGMNRPGFPGECFICELRLPDHRFRWKH
uniref:S6 family peptidase n=1 Tax=Escherichia coli TaxID=562 RepID=UPI0034A5658F